MSAFELNNHRERSEVQGAQAAAAEALASRRLREECIIALKVYDSCRQQDCLTEAQIGPARAAENGHIGDEHFHEGDVIDPPENAAAVTIDRLRVRKIIIVSKEPNAFKNGYWDIDLKYVFEYRLTFREADGSIIGSVRANSIFNKKITLFGSIGTDIVISTDLFNHHGCDSTTLDSDPFILVEAKAVPLSAELRYVRRRNITSDDLAPTPNQVAVTIGLFTIIKLFRIVQLSVESRGFCVPEECEELSPLNPCEFFDGLDFPFNVFAPPQLPEFVQGVQAGILPLSNSGHRHCGCNDD